MKCFVPNCENTIGITFPKDPSTRNAWLEGLNLKNLQINAQSFVCLDHFKQADFNENLSSSNASKLKNGAVPSTKAKKDVQNICRTCTTRENLKMTISDEFNGKLISHMLTTCAHPLEISSEDDNLPKYICENCFEVLKTAFEFRHQVLKVDQYLKSQTNCVLELYGTNQPEELIPLGDIESDTKIVKKNYKKQSNSCQSSETEVVDEELHMTNDNAIVHIITKDFQKEKSEYMERHSTHSITSSAAIKDTLKLGDVTAKAVHKEPAMLKQYEPPKKILKLDESSGPKSQNISSFEKKTRVVKEIKIQNVNVPERNKTESIETYKSPLGQLSCTSRLGIFGSSFIEAGNCLFLFGLMKKGVRNLQCIVPTCKSTAEQKLTSDNSYESFITIKTPHNHVAPTESLKKKQIFFHVMRKKMQNDKGLNIRNLYEEMCIEEPELRSLVPLRNVINEICRYQFSCKLPHIKSFQHFHDIIETELFEKLHFTHNGKQFYQERFSAEDGSLALVFCNTTTLDQISYSEIMYVDASFKIDSEDNFKYQLVTVLVWLEDSYYPILFALVNKKTQEIFKKVFVHLRDNLAPKLKPQQIITDYEASLYYALGETYLESHIGGSVFYYTQNIYKKICSLELSRELETNSCFRNIYHMLLMLPLLPVNTILDGFNNIESQARDMGLQDLARPIFEHVQQQWILNVTPELFCVHRLENRINENVIAPFKKLRDFLLLTKGKMQKTQFTIVHVVSKLIELEAFLNKMYSKPDKKSFGRDLSTSQKKTVLRAWQYIETHPKININNFFTKVLGYIKCMENQLWIWGFYRFTGNVEDNLINANNFSIVSSDDCKEHLCEEQEDMETTEGEELLEEQIDSQDNGADETALEQTGIVVEAVIDEHGGVVLQSQSGNSFLMQEEISTSVGVQDHEKQYETTYLKYVYE